jgi:hypothetical protein
MVLGLPQLQHAEVEVIEPAHVEVQEPGGVYTTTNAVPVRAEDTACVELIGAAESSNCKARGVGGLGRRRGWARAICCVPKRRGRGEARSLGATASLQSLQDDSAENKRVLEALPPQGDVRERARATMGEHKLKLETLPRGGPTECEHEHALPM